MIKIALAVAIAILIIACFPRWMPARCWRNKQVRRLARKHEHMTDFLTGTHNEPAVGIAAFYRKQETAGTTVVGLHYTDWCHFCKLMKPVWHSTTKQFAGNTAYKFVEINEEKTPTAGVASYPTIARIKDGKVSQYHGGANASALKSFIVG